MSGPGVRADSEINASREKQTVRLASSRTANAARTAISVLWRHNLHRRGVLPAGAVCRRGLPAEHSGLPAR